MQLARLLERSLSDDEARMRIDAQWPTEEKARRATFVIRTDGPFEKTDRQVDEILENLRT